MTTLAMPVPLRAFAELLRLDQGQVPGRAVLFASVIGFDTVEKHQADLAAASGIPTERLREIADTGRHALSITSPVRPEQHLVSKALSGRFCGPTSHGKRLFSHNLQFGTAKLLAPRAVGRLTNFVKIDSERTEQLWGLTEQDLPAAIDAARTRRVLQNPKHVAVIKDAIALHYARSLDTLDTADRVWQEGLVSVRERFLADRPMIEHLYYLKHGFYATGAAVADEIAGDLLKEATTLYESGAAFRLRVVDIFEATRQMAASARLEIIRPRRGQFLLGDVPAISYPRDQQAFGTSERVPFGDAATVILPLSPTRLAALSSADRFEPVGAAAVRHANAPPASPSASPRLHASSSRPHAVRDHAKATDRADHRPL